MPVPTFIPTQYMSPTWDNPKDTLHSQVGAPVYHQVTPLDLRPPSLEIPPTLYHDNLSLVRWPN